MRWIAVLLVGIVIGFIVGYMYAYYVPRQAVITTTTTTTTTTSSTHIATIKTTTTTLTTTTMTSPKYYVEIKVKYVGIKRVGDNVYITVKFVAKPLGKPPMSSFIYANDLLVNGVSYKKIQGAELTPSLGIPLIIDKEILFTLKMPKPKNTNIISLKLVIDEKYYSNEITLNIR